jgi:cytoskeletal protein CcmA (bactofilin family)
MFRRKEEEMQEELDVVDAGEAKVATNAGGAYQPTGAAAGRAPVPAAGAGYRPQQAPMGGAVGAAPQQSMSAAQSGNASRPASSGVAAADVRQAPAGGMKNNKRILTVGNDILLKGEIATCDRLVIEGMVDASLKDVHTVEISETGSFKGTASIEDAEISGLFEGDLTVRNRLTIYSTGKVRGKISYGEIEIERGGELTGEIRSGSSSDTGATGKDKKAAA